MKMLSLFMRLRRRLNAGGHESGTPARVPRDGEVWEGLGECPSLPQPNRTPAGVENTGDLGGDIVYKHAVSGLR